MLLFFNLKLETLKRVDNVQFFLQAQTRPSLDLPREVTGDLLAISAATGAVKAAELGYRPVVQHLITVTR